MKVVLIQHWELAIESKSFPEPWHWIGEPENYNKVIVCNNIVVKCVGWTTWATCNIPLDSSKKTRVMWQCNLKIQSRASISPLEEVRRPLASLRAVSQRPPIKSAIFPLLYHVCACWLLYLLHRQEIGVVECDKVFSNVKISSKQDLEVTLVKRWKKRKHALGTRRFDFWFISVLVLFHFPRLMRRHFCTTASGVGVGVGSFLPFSTAAEAANFIRNKNNEEEGKGQGADDIN